MDKEKSVHLESEERMGFETPGGKVYLEAGEEMMTPFGGFVPFAGFLKKAGIIEELAMSSPVERSSPNASRSYDVICSFLLTTLIDGSRFSHVNRLREDPLLKEVFGMERMVGDDTIRRYFKLIEARSSGDWIASATKVMWGCLPENFILDWDSTVQTRYGLQEGAEVGYNPHKHGRASHHPLMAVVAGTRLCRYYRWRGGKASSASEWIEAMEEASGWIGRTPWLNRGDVGFCSEGLIRWHEEEGRPHCLFKLRLTKNLKRAISRIKDEDWEGCPTPGVLQTSEIKLKLSGWSNSRRVIIGRRCLGEVASAESGEFWSYAKYNYEAYVTTLSEKDATSWQIIELYRQRADCENVFDELKNQWGFSGFCSRSRNVTEVAARLLLVAYNLWNLFLRLLEPSRHVEARHGRRWFLFLSARLVRCSRQRTWKMAVSGQWWNSLKDGYKRVLAWLALTAPQLHDIQPQAPPFNSNIVSI